jgi:hypothetical protein
MPAAPMRDASAMMTVIFCPGPNTAGVGGNLLIRQEKGNSGNSGARLTMTQRARGSITFTLLSGSAFRLMSFAAIDDGRFSISVGGLVLGELEPGADNEILFHGAVRARP